MVNNSPVLQSITPSDLDWNRYISLYIDAFPIDERRSIEVFTSMIQNRIFSANKILVNGNFVGLFNYWTFDTNHYIEHFAIDLKMRNAGIGSTLLSDFSKDKRVFLECEPPTTSDSVRRVNFYQKHQFRTFPFNYIQPPYSHLSKPIEMLLMTNSFDLSNEIFNDIVSQLKKSVYNIK